MTAKVVAVFSQKGGAGKTNITMQVGGTLGRQKIKVLIVDMDPQATATRWASQAGDKTPFPAAVVNLATMGGRMHREIKNHVENYDVILIDCPPGMTEDAPKSAMLVADLALIPVAPSAADIWSAQSAKQLALASKDINESLLIRVVGSMSNNTKMASDIFNLLREDENIPLLETTIGYRAAYKECLMLGSTVHHVPRAAAAIVETNALADEVMALLDI